MCTYILLCTKSDVTCPSEISLLSCSGEDNCLLRWDLHSGSASPFPLPEASRSSLGTGYLLPTLTLSVCNTRTIDKDTVMVVDRQVGCCHVLYFSIFVDTALNYPTCSAVS